MIQLNPDNRDMKNTGVNKNDQHIIFGTLFFCGVFFCALLAFLFVQNNVFQGNTNIDSYSEGFVVRKIQNDANGTSPKGGFLPLPPGNVIVFHFPNDAYRSNPGWQGIVLSSIREVSLISVDRFVTISKAFYSFIFFSCFFGFFFCISRIVANPVSMAFTLFYAIICAQFTGFSSNLFWVAFLVYLGPLLIFAIAYRKDNFSHELRLKSIFLIAGISVFIRALCGYEWVSFIILNNAWAVLFVLFTSPHKKNITEQLIIICKVILCGVLGFVAATLVHVVQGYIAFSDLTQAIDPIFSRALAHAGHVSTANETFKTFQAPAVAYPSANYLDVFKVYFNYEMIVPLTSKVYWAAICIIGIGTLVSTFIQRRYSTKTSLMSLQSLWLLCILSYIPPISWLILQPSHALVHPFINLVMFASIPFPLTLISAHQTVRFFGAKGFEKIRQRGLFTG